MIEVFHKALSQYGVKEIVGEKHNPVIVDWFRQIGHGWVKDDEMAWCSTFVNWCALVTGYEYTGLLNARSWLTVGENLSKPELGCIVVFWRVKFKSIYGHIGFYVNEDDHYIYVLGGNQSNEVCIQKYPKSKLLAYRKLNKV